MPGIAFGTVSGLMALLFLLIGCKTFNPPTARVQNRSDEIIRRASALFHTGVLYKPAEPEPRSLVACLAPLIIQHSLEEGSDVSSSRPLAALNTPVVYGGEQQLKIGTALHVVLTFVWGIAPQQTGASVNQLAGVRMVLDSAGAPVIWEVIPGQQNVRVFLIAESLDRLAAAEFGAAVPGTRSSTECEPSSKSPALVARVIRDGPIPMGPIVYQEAPSGQISTVLCRCMPAQVRNITASLEYRLVPLANLAEEIASQSGIQLKLPEGDLETCLRLPATF